MQRTLEVRWFLEGVPPAAVQSWFESECPGELLSETPEIRQDLYFLGDFGDWSRLKALNPHLTRYEQLNLKLRQGNLELKLRQEALATQTFGNGSRSNIWQGNLEYWHKWTEEELKSQNWFFPDSILERAWISVRKVRQQRSYRGVDSELTRLKIKNESWWTLAFEMLQTSDRHSQESEFEQAIDLVCQTYRGPQLSAANSYSYSRWLLELGKQINLTESK